MRREGGMTIALIVTCLALFISNPDFAGQSNAVNLLRQISMLGIFAIGISFVIITGWISQDRASHAANAYYGAFVPCDGTTPFAAPASSSGAPALFKGRSAMLFSGGRAEVSGEAQAYDPVEGTYIYRHLAAAIQLRGGRNP